MIPVESPRIRGNDVSCSEKSFVELGLKEETSSLPNSEDVFGAKAALTWCSGQGHPTANRHYPRDAFGPALRQVRVFQRDLFLSCVVA
jgi:hypothetical protein